MYRKAKMFFMYHITPSHLGSGDGLGIIDMPIQREKQTGYPKIEGSSLKGSIREVFRENFDKAKINITFGPEKGDEHAGSLGFTDGRILLFPVKSVKGVFAWITSPSVLKRFAIDLKLVDNNSTLNIPPVKASDDETSYCVTTGDSKVKLTTGKGQNAKDFVILEEYSFEPMGNDCNAVAEFIGGKLFMRDELKDRLVILSDDDFKDFVNMSTEVITRTKIDPDTGTVQQGALFTEEYLPAETIMYSLALASPVFKKDNNDTGIKDADQVMKFFDKIPEVVQMGGNATLGKGLVKIIKGANNG